MVVRAPKTRFVVKTIDKGIYAFDADYMNTEIPGMLIFFGYTRMDMPAAFSVRNVISVETIKS